MIWIPLLSSLLAVLLAVGVRYRQVGWRHATPFSLPWAVWAVGAALAAMGLVACLVQWRRAPPAALRRRALLELLAAFLPLFCLVWGVLPSEGPTLRQAPLGAGLLALYGWLWHRRKAPPAPGRRARARQALRLVAPATLGVVVACAVIAVATRTAPRLSALAISVVTYPLFAAVQLVVFAELALPRLGALTPRRWPVLAVAASLFALIHWPNGFLMVVCFAAMLLWADIWLRTRSLGVLAVAMGVAATAVAQLLPAPLTRHMGTGPGYVLQGHRDELMTRERALLAELTSDAFYTGEAHTPEGFVAAVCRRVLGRSPNPDELALWFGELQRSRRESVARSFLGSGEYVERAARTPGLPAVSEERVAELASAEWLRDHGGDWTGFVRGLYLELLGRAPAPAELADWRPDPEITERTHLVWSFLHGEEWASRRAEPAWAVRHLGPLLAH